MVGIRCKAPSVRFVQSWRAVVSVASIVNIPHEIALCPKERRNSTPHYLARECWFNSSRPQSGVSGSREAPAVANTVRALPFSTCVYPSRRSIVRRMSVAIGNHLTAIEAAEILGVTPGRVRQFHTEKRLVGVKVGPLLLFERSKVEAFARKDRPEGRPKNSRNSRNGR